MILFYATLAALALTSAFDGWTTVRFVKLGYEEGTTAWLLGKTPSWKVVYFRGGAFIAGELALALAVTHYSVVAGAAVCGALLFQSFTHIFEGTRNLRLT